MSGWPQKPPPGCQIDWGDPLAQSLVACWLENEGSGNRIQNLSGNGNTGTFGATTKSPTWVAGKFGYCLSFDGGDTVNLTGLPTIVGTFTVSLWVCSTLTADNTMLLDCSAGRLILYWRHSGELALYDGAGIQRWFGAPPSDGLWHHLVFVANASTLLCNCYVDGIQKGVTRTYVPANLGGTIALGSRYDGTDYYFTGLMDDVQIWKGALTVLDVTRLCREPFAMIRRPRIGLWTPTFGGDGNTYIETINDGLGMTDAVSRACAFARTLMESMGTVDTVGGASVAIRAMSETMGLADSLNKGEVKVFSDALGIVDSLIRVWEASRSFAETLGETDSLSKDESKALSDSIGLIDVPVNVSVVLRTVADSLGLTDNLSLVWEGIRTLADSLGITDAMSEVFEGSGVFVRTINDGVGLTDSLTSVQTLLRLMSDNLGMADAVASVFAVSRIISDSEGITDGVVLGRMISLSDSLGITDDVTRLVQYLRTQSDAEGLLDSMARVVVAFRTVNDTVGISDAMCRQFGALMKAVWAFMLLKHNR
jgi:hypothetical protein